MDATTTPHEHQHHASPASEERRVNDDNKERIVILKIGGSSITNKAKEETLNEEALDWFANLVAESIDTSFLSIGSVETPEGNTRATSVEAAALGRRECNKEIEIDEKTRKIRRPKFIVVHGAGSFGHHSAKRYGLRCGKAAFSEEFGRYDRHTAKKQRLETLEEITQRRHQMEGLSKTRQSVQKLNAATVGCLIKHGVNAVGISPGMTIPRLRAHGASGLPDGMSPYSYADDDSPRGMADLIDSIDRTLKAGLVPVVHGDACLLYDGTRAGILGGDTIAEGLATLWNRDANNSRESRISEVIFITDVAGVFTSDPKSDESAELVRSLRVDGDTGEVSIDNRGGSGDKSDGSISGKEGINLSGSSHAHDVTGGLKAKLGAAVSIVRAGMHVIVSQCGSGSTEKFVKGDWESVWDVEAGTLLSLRNT